MKRAKRNGINVPTREPVPYVSPGRPMVPDLWRPEMEARQEQITRPLVTLPAETPRSAPRRRAVSPATPAQRARAKAMGCVVTGATEGVDPAHLIPRSMTTIGQDEPLAVVGLRRDLHRAYDLGDIDLLPFLTHRHDDAVAFAVERVGLITALERITNAKWAPLDTLTRRLGPEVRL